MTAPGTGLVAAGSAETALAFIEIGAVALGLALLARLAGRLGITAVPLYLLAGLMFGEGGIVQLNVSESFISLTAEIGVLLLLFTLGLEYSDVELREGLRTGVPTGVVDMVLNATPGVLAGTLERPQPRLIGDLSKSNASVPIQLQTLFRWLVICTKLFVRIAVHLLYHLREGKTPIPDHL